MTFVWSAGNAMLLRGGCFWSLWEGEAWGQVKKFLVSGEARDVASGKLLEAVVGGWFCACFACVNSFSE